MDNQEYPFLYRLYLSYNKIESITKDTIKGAPNLYSFDLNSNLITDFELIELPSLQRLYLSSNALKKFQV